MVRILEELPTCDVDSLEILSLAQWAPLPNVPVCTSLDYASLPVLQDRNEELYGSSLRRHLWTHALNHWQASPRDKADALAWCTRVEKEIGDLVWLALFGVPANWAKRTRSAYCDQLSFPDNILASRYFYYKAKTRLESAGLWGADLELLDTYQEQLAQATDPLEKSQLDSKSKRTQIKARYHENRVVQFAKQSLSGIEAKLGSNDFFYEQLSVLDLVLYSKLAFLVYPKLPKPSLSELLHAHSPSLVAHTRRVHQRLFGDGPLSLEYVERPRFSISRILQSLQTLPDSFHRPQVGKKLETKLERDFARKRAYFLTGVAASVGLFTYWQGLLSIPSIFVPVPLIEDEDD